MTKWTIGRRIAAGYAVLILLLMASVVFATLALRSSRGMESGLSVSDVTFRPLNVAEIEAYWSTGEPADKAGGYAVQGRAAVFIERISGSYSGIVGLPLFETAALLASVGWTLSVAAEGAAR